MLAYTYSIGLRERIDSVGSCAIDFVCRNAADCQPVCELDRGLMSMFTVTVHDSKRQLVSSSITCDTHIKEFEWSQISNPMRPERGFFFRGLCICLAINKGFK